jgi:hypothetical protein
MPGTTFAVARAKSEQITSTLLYGMNLEGGSWNKTDSMPARATADAGMTMMWKRRRRVLSVSSAQNKSAGIMIT